MRRLNLSVAVRMFVLTGSAVLAQAPENQKDQEYQRTQKAKPPEPAKTYAFEMSTKNWDTVLEWLTDQTGQKLIAKRLPTGTFNYVAVKGEKHTLPEIIDILNEGLMPQKMLLLNLGKSFTIVPADEKVDPAIIMRIDIADLSKYGNTEVVSITYKVAYEVAEDIAPAVKKQLGPFGVVIVLHKSNQLILQDTAGNLKRIKKELDRLEKEEYDIRKASEKRLATDKEALKVRSIEVLVAHALKNNPDIRVAESKVREAEAELNRARLQVSQKLISVQRDIVAGEQAVRTATEQVQRFQELFKSGAGSLKSLQTAESDLQKLKAEQARLEAELPYLLGNIMSVGDKSADGHFLRLNTGEGGTVIFPLTEWLDTAKPRPAVTGVQIKTTEPKEPPAKKETKATEKPMESYLQTYRSAANQSGNWFYEIDNNIRALNIDMTRQQALPSDKADKIRKALDTPITVDFHQTPAKDVLRYLQERAKGFNLVEQVNEDKLAFPVDLRLTEPVPVGAIFQFLEDRFGWRFVVREYGIVVTEAGKAPPGAVHLQEFWKNRPAEKK